MVRASEPVEDLDRAVSARACHPEIETVHVLQEVPAVPAEPADQAVVLAPTFRRPQDPCAHPVFPNPLTVTSVASEPGDPAADATETSAYQDPSTAEKLEELEVKRVDRHLRLTEGLRPHPFW